MLQVIVKKVFSNFCPLFLLTCIQGRAAFRPEYVSKGDDKTRGLVSPTGIAVSPVPPHSIFVADTGNHRIRVFSPNMRLSNSFGRLGPIPGTFLRPSGLAFDDEGTLSSPFNFLGSRSVLLCHEREAYSSLAWSNPKLDYLSSAPSHTE